MDINSKLIEHVAQVSRLSLSDEEKKEFLPQLKQIIEAFSEIKEVDTTGIEPSYHSVKLRGELREDMPKESLKIEDALKNSKNNRESYVKGPKVL